MTNYTLSDEQQKFFSSQFADVGEAIDFICVLNEELFSELAVQEAEIVILRKELEKATCNTLAP